MQNEQSRRKPRIPISPEELHYYKKIKELKELKKEEDFKATRFYKIFNRLNIVLSGFITYCILSILVFCNWQQSQILKAESKFGEFDSETKKPSITEIKITTYEGEFIPIKASHLFQPPKENEVLYIGRDFLFNKILKVKLAFDDRDFWHINSYPSFVLCVFALCLGFFVYNVNKHLNANGLLMASCLFIIASLYFVLV